MEMGQHQPPRGEHRQDGAVAGAEIVERFDLGPPKPKPNPKPAPAPAPKRVPARQVVIHRQPSLTASRARLEDEEMRRRMDWLESTYGQPADPELVIRGMQMERHGPSPAELYAETIGRRVAA